MGFGRVFYIVGLIVIVLLTVPAASAYIDPGTGGYLLSSLWGWFVGLATLAFVVVGHFFRHTLKNWWTRLHRKHKVLIIAIPLVVVICIAGYFVYENNANNAKFTLPDFDPKLVNVTKNTDKAFDGYTFIDGKLMDMNGAVVHQWKYGYLGVIDKNGDLYGQREYESPIWGRYSWNGSVIWEMKLPIHHEIVLTPNNTVIVLTKEVHEYYGRNVEFDVIAEFDKNGTFIRKWSTWDHLAELHQYHANLELDKPMVSLAQDKKDNLWKNTSVWGGNYDYYHMNAVSLVPVTSMEGKHPAFNPGNYLISFRHGSMVFIISKDTGKVLWRAVYSEVKDNLEGPHSPHMLPDGNILLYDNGRYRGWTRLLLLNPVTLGVVWQYRNDAFFSYSQGFVQQLPNNNMLVTESDKGHVFELDPAGEVVWEWWNPAKFIDPGNDNFGKRHDIYRAIRYDKAFIDGFLKNGN